MTIITFDIQSEQNLFSIPTIIKVFKVANINIYTNAFKFVIS